LASNNVSRQFLISPERIVSQPQSPLLVGQILEIRFPSFTPRITIHSDDKLTIVTPAKGGFMRLRGKFIVQRNRH
jgi:hypothetical protein